MVGFLIMVTCFVTQKIMIAISKASDLNLLLVSTRRSTVLSLLSLQ
jgi:hypothetical protein